MRSLLYSAPLFAVLTAVALVVLVLTGDLSAKALAPAAGLWLLAGAVAGEEA